MCRFILCQFGLAWFQSGGKSLRDLRLSASWFGAFQGGKGMTDRRTRNQSLEMEQADEIREKNRLEIKSTIIISIATLAIAWCSYQNTLWSGQQSFSLADANKYARNAKQEALMIAQRQQIDAAITMNVLTAVLEKKNTHIDYYVGRGRHEMRNLLQAWLKTVPPL